MILIHLNMIEHTYDNRVSAGSSPGQKMDVGLQQSASAVSVPMTWLSPWTERYDLLGVTELQDSQCRSLVQIVSLSWSDEVVTGR
jgi:hypothetical protein